MNKSIFLTTLFAGFFALAAQADVHEGNAEDNHSTASTQGSHGNSNSDVLKKLEQAPENSPWDPREHDEASQNNEGQVSE